MHKLKEVNMMSSRQIISVRRQDQPEGSPSKQQVSCLVYMFRRPANWHETVLIPVDRVTGVRQDCQALQLPLLNAHTCIWVKQYSKALLHTGLQGRLTTVHRYMTPTAAAFSITFRQLSSSVGARAASSSTYAYYHCSRASR